MQRETKRLYSLRWNSTRISALCFIRPLYLFHKIERLNNVNIWAINNEPTVKGKIMGLNLRVGHVQWNFLNSYKAGPDDNGARLIIHVPSSSPSSMNPRNKILSPLDFGFFLGLSPARSRSIKILNSTYAKK